MGILENPIFWLIVFIVWGWLCFYFGTYYGKGVYRTCRYYKLKWKRRKSRKKWVERIQLYVPPQGKYRKE